MSIILGSIKCQLFIISISDLNRPTEDCSRHVTHRILVIAICTTIGLVVVVVAIVVIVILLIMYKYYSYKERQRIERRDKMSMEEKQHIEMRSDQLREKLPKPLQDKEIKKELALNRKQIRGDGPDSQ